MTTSQTTGLCEPILGEKIPAGTLGYIRTRNRNRAYDLVIRELKASGITQAELARRLGKGQEVVSRLLSRAQNWELDTFSELMFGIRGAVPNYSASYPLSQQVGEEVKEPQPAPAAAPVAHANSAQSALLEEFFLNRGPAPIAASPAPLKAAA